MIQAIKTTNGKFFVRKMSTKLCGMIFRKKSPRVLDVSMSAAGRLRASMLVFAKITLATTNAALPAITSIPTNAVSVLRTMRNEKPFSSLDVKALNTAQTKYGINSIKSRIYISATSPAKPDTAGNNRPTIIANIAASTICQDKGMLRFFTIIQVIEVIEVIVNF